MNDFKLTEYGTIISQNGSEYSVDDFIKRRDERDKELLFFPNDEIFSIGNDGAHILLAEKQKRLFEEGRPSPELLKLIAFAEECQYKKREEDINKNFIRTGEFPTDPEELTILKEYLKKELRKTNAKIISGSVISAIPLAIFGITAYLTYHFKLFGDGTWTNLLISVPVGAWVSLATSVMLWKFVDIDTFQFGEVIEAFKQKKILEKKIECLDASEEKQMALELRKELSIEGLENKEIKSVSENGSIFLQELEEVKSKIVMLPEEERDSYYKELIAIVEDYSNQVYALLDDEGKKLFSSAYLWKLNSSMLPMLYELGGRISTRLSTLEAKEEVRATLEGFKKSVKDLSSEQDYVDGWTDGYTDDLTSGGVAYAGTSKKSC